MFPAARIFDPITHDGVAPCGTIAGPLAGPCPLPPVVIEQLLAAHVGCTVLCTGLTSLGPVHPPTIPVPPLPGGTAPPSAPPSAPGGGPGASAPSSSTEDSTEEESEGEAEEELPLEPGMKQFSIRVVGGGSVGGSIKICSGGLQGVIVEIVDETDGEKARYIIPSVHGGFSFGTALSGELKFGGPPNKFPAPVGVSVKDFFGRIYIGEATANLDDLHLPADNMSYVSMNFGAMWRGDSWWDVHRESFWIHDFKVGDSKQLGTVAGLMAGAGEMIYIPFSHEEIEKPEPKPPPIVPPTPPPPPPPPAPIVKGSATVLIHGMPAARWFPSLDASACGVFLGDPKLTPIRTVFIG